MFLFTFVFSRLASSCRELVRVFSFLFLLYIGVSIFLLLGRRYFRLHISFQLTCVRLAIKCYVLVLYVHSFVIFHWHCVLCVGYGPISVPCIASAFCTLVYIIVSYCCSLRFKPSLFLLLSRDRTLTLVGCLLDSPPATRFLRLWHA